MTVPLWLHIVVVVCLLTSNALTFAIGLHWNRRLKRALDTRDVLLGDKQPGKPETYGDLLPKLFEKFFK